VFSEGISVVIPTSSASYTDRLRLCLDSVRAQTVPDQYLDIVITCLQHVDDKSDLTPLVELARLYDATLVFYRDQCKKWQPSLSRNIGFRRAPCRIVACVDADTVLHPQTLEAAARHILAGGRAVRVPTRLMSHGPEHPVFRQLGRKTYEENVLKGKAAHGPGCVIVAPAGKIHRIRGWDERYIGYGPADWDYVKRLEMSGLDIIDLAKSDGIWSMHIDHPRAVSNKDVQRNRAIYAELETSTDPARNKKTWGGLTTQGVGLGRVVTAVIPASFAGLAPHLDLCIRSIRMQDYPKNNIDVVVTFAHSGEDQPVMPIAYECWKRNGTLVFHRHDHGIFPPALARNVGVRRGLGTVIAFIDADMVLHPHTFKLAVPCLDGGKSIVHVSPAMIQGENPSFFSDLDAVRFTQRAMAAGSAPGTGACLFVTQAVIKKTNSYDENYVGYACTDWDFTSRMKPLGISIIELSDLFKIRAMHQPHGKRTGRNPPSDANRRYYAKMKGREPKRNPNGWGGFLDKPYDPDESE
jgi:glycosyltransferase involved in cell wall biosynthesis